MNNRYQIEALAASNSNWMAKAKCRNEQKATSHFFEEFERAGAFVKRELVTFCNNCEVIDECYDHAKAVGETGLWGGTYFTSGRPKNPMKARYLETQRDIASTVVADNVAN